jgi:K+-transporting ATPase A subunit
MMEAETISETPHTNSIFTQLIVWKNLIQPRVSFKIISQLWLQITLTNWTLHLGLQTVSVSKHRSRYVKHLRRHVIIRWRHRSLRHNYKGTGYHFKLLCWTTLTVLITFKILMFRSWICFDYNVLNLEKRPTHSHLIHKASKRRQVVPCA